MSRVLRCYAEGRGDEWEAICLDLDIAVQGESFEDVYHSLNEAIALYLQSVAALPKADQPRLLYRPAPLGIRLQFLMRVLRDAFRKHDDDNHFQHQFTLPLAA